MGQNTAIGAEDYWKSPGHFSSLVELDRSLAKPVGTFDWEIHAGVVLKPNPVHE